MIVHRYCQTNDAPELMRFKDLRSMLYCSLMRRTSDWRCLTSSEIPENDVKSTSSKSPKITYLCTASTLPYKQSSPTLCCPHPSGMCALCVLVSAACCPPSRPLPTAAHTLFTRFDRFLARLAPRMPPSWLRFPNLTLLVRDLPRRRAEPCAIPPSCAFGTLTNATGAYSSP